MLSAKINFVKFKLVTFSIIVFSFLFILGVLFANSLSSEKTYEFYNHLFCCFGTTVYIWGLWSWFKLKKELLCPYVFFFSVAFVFMFGQSMLKALNIPLLGRDLHLMYPTLLMLKANVYTTLSLLAFHIGALAFAKVKD